MGGFLVILGVGVLIWVVVSLFQLFTTTSAFLVLDQIVPRLAAARSPDLWHPGLGAGRCFEDRPDPVAQRAGLCCKAAPESLIPCNPIMTD
jgi:hypothetical protein